jgi:hypothetical protein
MNTPQATATPQQPQATPPKRPTPPEQAPQPIAVVEATPSEASDVLDEVRGSPFAIGDAIGAVPASEQGLQLLYCVTRPGLPGPGINHYQHQHIHQYQVGNKLLGPPVDVFWDAIQMAFRWRSFETFAINHITNLNPGAKHQIRVTWSTPALKWQGVIPHHPWYDWRANAKIRGNESWRQFVEAIGDAARHGQNSQLWCISDDTVRLPPTHKSHQSF